MTAVKFEFNSQFDGGAGARDAAEKAVVKKRIEESHVAGKAEGFDEGQSETLVGIEAHASATLERIETLLKGFFKTHNAIEDRIRKDSVKLAITAAKKIAPAAMKEMPIAEIEAVILECLTTCHKEEKIIIRIPDSLSEVLSTHMDKIQSSVGYEGKVQIKPDETMSKQDCLIEWNNGGSERNEDELLTSIDKLIENYLIAPSTEEHAPDADKPEEQPN